jgi:hypothetical protein
MIVMVKVGKKRTVYVLAVIPGNARVDLEAIKQLFGGTYVSFASSNIAEELAGSMVGTVLPFAFDERLVLIADPALIQALFQRGASRSFRRARYGRLRAHCSPARRTDRQSQLKRLDRCRG